MPVRESKVSVTGSRGSGRVGRTGQGRLELAAEADNLNLGALEDRAALDAPGDDRAAALDRKDVLDRHQERLLEVAQRLVEPLVDGVHELEHALLANLVVAVLERGEGGAHDDRRRLAVKAVRLEQVAHLHLDELEHLAVVNLVHLVDVDDELLDPDLAREEQVLARLRHLPVRGRDDDDAAVPFGGWARAGVSGASERKGNEWNGHLRGSGDHVLDLCEVGTRVSGLEWWLAAGGRREDGRSRRDRGSRRERSGGSCARSGQLAVRGGRSDEPRASSSSRRARRSSRSLESGAHFVSYST